MPMPFSMPSRVPPMPPQRPMPKPPEKAPASQPARGLFGKDNYLEFGTLKGRIGKDEYYKPAPGYSNPWGKEKREAFVDEIRKLGGDTYGLQKTDAPQIIRKMEEAKRVDPGKSDEWVQKIKMFKSWVEGN